MGSQHAADTIGRRITEWLDDRHMCCLNNGSPTRFSPADGTGTAPDLTAAGASIAPRCSWATLDPIGSDYHPLLTTVEGAFFAGHIRPEGRLNLRRCNWDAYQATVSEHLADFDANVGSLEAASQRFYRTLLSAARHAALFGSIRKAKLWWSAACGEAHRNTVRAFRRLCAGLPSGAADYATACHDADHVCRREKRDAWRSYASSLSVRTPESRVWNALRSLDGRARKPLPDRPLTVGGKRILPETAKANAAAAP